MSVRDKFKEWCSKKGGDAEVNEKLKLYSCNLQDYIEAEDVEEFIRFIDENRRDIMKERVDVCVEYSSKLLGGYEEGEHVCYYPIDDKIGVSARYYSDYGLLGEVKKGLPKIFKRRETIDTKRVVFEEERGAEFNDATGEWMGLGEVKTSFRYRVAKENPDVIAIALDKAREKAEARANEALDYIKPIEEEEE